MGGDYVWGKLDESQVEYFDPFWSANMAISRAQLTVQRLHAGHVSTNAPESFVEQRGMDVSQQMGHNKNAFREMNPPEMRMWAGKM